MAFIHNIRTVAHYEAKTLRRSWFFRLFSISALLLFTMMNIGMFSPVGEESWEFLALPSSIPLINLYLLNIGQAIVVIFLAADFLKRDKKLDTNEVLYTRSMSNMEYVLGKTVGILRLFLGLNILILLIAVIINIITPLATVDIGAYLSYLLLISVPTIVFSLGFAYLLMSLIRNQAITFLVLLGYAAVVLFYLYFRTGFFFDYMAFGLPLTKSGIVGYGDFSYIFFQRFMYFSLGMASVMLTIIIFRRLPQSPLQGRLARVFLVLFIIAGGYSAYYILNRFNSVAGDKKTIIETNSKYENTRFLTSTDAVLTVEHNGSRIEANAMMTLRNDHPAACESVVLSLNPGLEVSAVTTGDGSPIPFTRDFNMLTITPGQPVAPGSTVNISVTYAGTINEPFCYPWFDDDIKLYPSRIAMVNIAKRQAFLGDDYVLLTPETHWYPVAALNYYPSNPARIKVDFTKYTLNVKTRSDLTAVSQGVTSGSNGEFSIAGNEPLTGLTLAIGNYLTDTITAAGINFRSHYFPGNDFYRELFSEISDTLPNLIQVLMTDLETGFSTKYPFTSLSFVEVPVQFFSYPKRNTQTRAEVQPSLLLLPERLATIRSAGFNRSFKQQKKNAERDNTVITDKDLKIRIFTAFARNTFISGTNARFTQGNIVNQPSRYLLRPSFYFFKNNFYSNEFPVINSVFESHLQKVSNMIARGMQMGMGGLTDNDKANLILMKSSLKDVLNASPGEDTISAVLTVKGDYLFNLMRAKAGIEEFKNWFTAYLEDNRFTRVDMNKFDADLKAAFGFTLSEYLPDWFEGTDIPGFFFTDVKVEEVVVGERTRYQVTFTASNHEPVPGLFNVTFMSPGAMGGRGGGMGGGMGSMQITVSAQGGGAMQRIEMAMQGRGMDISNINGIFFLDGNQAKRIRMLSENQPRAVTFNTVMAKNIPGEQRVIISEVGKAPRGTVPTEDEEILSSLPLLSESNEIIVDNEDPGFDRGEIAEASPIRRLLGISNNEGETYAQLRPAFLPEYWQPVVMTDFYGRYIKSAVYTRSGTGERKVSWSAVLESPGYYDVYAYIPKGANRMVMMGGMRMAGGGPGGAPGGGAPGGGAPAPQGGGTVVIDERGGARGQQQTPQYKEFAYTVFHDDGYEEITLEFETADPGWNKLGTYYLSADTARVELTNKSTARMVAADAVKWVKKNN